jgi:hypothetical protein
MNFKTLAVAAAIVAAGTANAAISSFSGGTSNGNGSLVLLMLDSTGANTQSLTVDLGLTFNDFASGGAYSKVGTAIVWDLANNTVIGSTIDANGVKTNISVAGVNDWASQLSIFKGASDAAETKWAVISGSQKTSTANAFLTTAPVGGPTSGQLNQQTTGLIANMTQITAPLIGNLGTTKGTITSADNGAFSAAATDSAYVGTAYGGVTPANNFGWKGNVKWNTFAANGSSQTFEQINANGTKAQIGAMNSFGYMDVGTFTLQGDTLTYTVGVPEPESYALAIVGLLGMAAVARRRAAK